MKTIALFRLRAALVCGVLINLCLVILRVLLYRPLLAMPGALRFVAEPILALLGCALFTVLATLEQSIERQNALRSATKWGVVGGVLLVTHMALENFGARVGENALLTVAFMVAVFLTWAISGYMVQQSTSRGTLALAAGCWSAVAGVLIAVAFGFALMFFDIPTAA